MQAKGTYTKGFQARSESTPAAVTKGPAGKAGPIKSLSVKPKDSQEYINITGLFEATGKKGDYLSGKAKDSTDRFYVFTNKDKKGNITGYALMIKDTTAENSKLEKVTDLKVVEKNGRELLVGEANGDNYYVQDVKKKA